MINIEEKEYTKQKGNLYQVKKEEGMRRMVDGRKMVFTDLIWEYLGFHHIFV